VKDFAVCTADGGDFKFPVETFLDIADREDSVPCTFNNTGRGSGQLKKLADCLRGRWWTKKDHPSG